MSQKKDVLKEEIEKYYYNTKNNLKQAAKILNCSVTVLRRLIFSYGMSPKAKTWRLSEFKNMRFIQPKKDFLTMEELKKYYLDIPCNMFIGAKRAGCSVAFMRRSLVFHGISGKKRSWNPNRKRKIDILNDKEWLKKELETKSMYRITKELHTTPGNVSYYARKHGLVSINISMSDRVKAGMKKRHPNGFLGENASNWKGGRRRMGTRGCYISIYSPNHPNARDGGYVLEHRIIMEKYLGRYLTSTELVHHKNGDKKDNRIENLELISDRGTHTRDHFERSNRTELAELEVDRLRKLLIAKGINPN